MSVNWLNNIGRTLKTNSPAILSGAAVAGVVGTVVLAVKATPRACEILAEAKEDKAEWQHGNLDSEAPRKEELTIQEKVQATWRIYLPATLSGAATIACIIGANSLGARRNAALAGAYTLVDQSFREYKEKVLEQVTPQKADKIEDELNKERLQRNPVGDHQVIVVGSGDVLCMDSLTGRYFKSDIERVRKAENQVNHLINTDMYASQNAFYEYIGIPSVTLGEELGWNIDNTMELHFSSLLNECDQPTLVIGYKRLPRANYHKL